MFVDLFNMNKDSDLNVMLMEAGRNLEKAVPWPNKYKSRRNGKWMFKFPDGTVSTFCYWVYENLKDPVIRINDKRTSGDEASNVYYCDAEHKPAMEISFLFSEVKDVNKWIAKNYLGVSDVPDWMCSTYSKYIKFGDPISGYFWSQKAKEAYDEAHKQKNRKTHHNRA